MRYLYPAKNVVREQAVVRMYETLSPYLPTLPVFRTINTQN